MAKKKTIEELEATAKEAEKRAREARKMLNERTKAEEGKLRADALKEIEKLVPKKTSWQDVPKIISEWKELATVAEGLSEIIEGNPDKSEIKAILLDWISERKANNSTFKRHYKGMF